MEKNKDYYRALIKKIRKDMDEEDKRELDNKIMGSVIKHKQFMKANKIFIYISIGCEVETSEIVKYSLEFGKTIYVPKVISKEKGMVAVKIKNLQELERGTMGILEPRHSEEKISPKDLDLSLIPGLAFDLKGSRIGYGGGYYDRFFKESMKRVSKIALAYEFQLFKDLPTEVTDIKVSSIITEKNIYNTF